MKNMTTSLPHHNDSPKTRKPCSIDQLNNERREQQEEMRIYREGAMKMVQAYRCAREWRRNKRLRRRLKKKKRKCVGEEGNVSLSQNRSKELSMVDRQLTREHSQAIRNHAHKLKVYLRLSPDKQQRFDQLVVLCAAARNTTTTLEESAHLTETRYSRRSNQHKRNNNQ